MEIDGRWVLSQTEMKPDDSTVICAGVFWREAVPMKRWGAVNEGIEAPFQRDKKSPQRVTFRFFPVHGITFWTQQAFRLKVDFRHEIFLRPVLHLGLCSGWDNQKHHRKSNTENAHADTTFLHNMARDFLPVLLMLGDLIGRGNH